jgi:hypothetical protein
MFRQMLVLFIFAFLAALTAGCTGDAREVVTATPDRAATLTAEPSATLQATPTLAEERVATATATARTPAEETAAAILTATPASSGPQGVDERISFAPGATSAAVENAVVRGAQDRYTLEAQAGQTMRVAVSSLEDNATFQVFAPDGQELQGAATGENGVWEQVLSQSGDYTIAVSSIRGNASYHMEVTIPPLTPEPAVEPTRILFEPDMTAALIEGHLDGGSRVTYVLGAVEEQQLSVSVSSPDESVIMAVTGEDGTVFLPLDAEKSGLYIVALPATMDYLIELVATGAGTDYQLVASASPLADLPERIEFDSGASSVTVSGALDVGGDLDNYILHAAAGHTVTVELFPPDGPLNVYLQSEDGADFYFATEGVLVAELTRTLDYVLTVSTPNAAGPTDYELRISIEPRNAPSS